MQQITNSFSKGLNKDINKINFPSDNYYHLQNGRVLSDTGNDGFSISNIEGNKLEIDNLYPDFIIIGYCNIRDDVVLFYANKNHTGAGKIVLLKYYDNALNPIKLYEHDDLGFKEAFPIKEDMVVGRYESPSVIKVYWTDGYNTLRYLNIAQDENTNGTSYDNYNIVRNTPIEKLNVLSNVNFTTPKFSSYTSGSLNSGMIQYAYRLYSVRGFESTFSPASELIPLTKYTDSSGTENLRGQATGGQALDTNSGRGVNIKIELSDDILELYDKIEVVSLWYSDRFGLPTISIIDQKEISKTIYTVDEGGASEYGTIELETFQALANDFTCKTITSKDNRLFAGNVTDGEFEVSYDARAYRYTHQDYTTSSTLYGNSGKISLFGFENSWIERVLTSGDPFTGTYGTTGVTYGTGEIPIDFDCVNIYNLLDYESGAPLKYKSDGVTLGGTGVNISYSFEEDICYQIDETASLSEISLNADITSQGGGSVGGVNIVGNKEWIHGSKKGYQRDEIYRFGIVFFDKKGRQSYVKWIGDIRMPSNNDIATTYYNSQGVFARPLYPKFEVNNVPSDSDGNTLDYRIVSVKRAPEDKTIISQGLGGFSIKEYSDSEFSANPILVSNLADLLDGHYKQPDDNRKDVPVINKKLLEYISPDVNFDKAFVGVANNRLEVIGAVSRVTIVANNGDVWDSADSNGFNGGSGYKIVVKYAATDSVYGDKTSSNIVELKVVKSSHFDFSRLNVGPYKYEHFVERYDAEHHSSRRGTSAAIAIDSEYTLDVSGDTEDKYLIFNIKSNVIGYNGNTYADRATNTYIPASGLNSGNCTNGDVFICMYDYLRSSYAEEVDANNRIMQNIFFPLETTYNLFYRYDDSFHRINQNIPHAFDNFNETGFNDPETGIYWGDLYLYDEVYSKIDESKLYFPKPTDFSDNKQFDCMVKYSNLKLNNEERDSWLQFKPNNFNELDSGYGELKTLVNFNNVVYCFQHKAVSIASINKQELISNDVGTSLVLGNGSILDRFDYLTTEIGIQNNNKVIKSLQALYWLDNNKRKIYTISGGIKSLDDLKGLNSWFEKAITRDSTLIGIYDSKYSEVLLTLGNSEAIFETVKTYTKPLCVINFNEVFAGSKVILSLNNIEYVFIASDITSGQLFEVESNLEDTIDNFISVVSNFSDSKYDIEKTHSSKGINVSIEGIVDGLGNINPKIEISAGYGMNTSSATDGGDGISITDYSSEIKSNNSTVYFDCYAANVPDKFEILLNGVVVASSHISNVGVLNGSIADFDPTLDSESVDDSLRWYIGTYNGICPTGISEFHTDTGLDENLIPMGYIENYYAYGQQRIWYKGINIGDTVVLKSRGGSVATGWGVNAGLVVEENTDISIVEVSDIQESSTVSTKYKPSTILEATSNSNILQVKDTEYFNFRPGRTYTIDGVADTRIEAIGDNTITTDKQFIGKLVTETITYTTTTHTGGVVSTGTLPFGGGFGPSVEISNSKVVTETKYSYLERVVNLSYYAKYKDVFTVAYNEITQSFTGFYDFIPNMYINLVSGFFSTLDKQKLFRHNVGEFCTFYGEVFDTYIDIIVSNSSSLVKEFNNLEYYSEVIKNGISIPNETIDTIQVENDYQQSEEVELYPLSDDADLENGEERSILYTEGNNIPKDSVNFTKLANIRRTIDHWRTGIPRHIEVNLATIDGDYSSDDYSGDYHIFDTNEDISVLNNYDRIRSPYCKIRLKFKNNEDKKFILHQINTLYQQITV